MDQQNKTKQNKTKQNKGGSENLKSPYTALVSNDLEIQKQIYIEELNQRVKDKILEKTNADFLIKLITKAEDLDEVHNIMRMGIMYKRTGFIFSARNENNSSNIKYLKKNTELSFETDKNNLTHKLIIGDNYDALKQLLINHRNKIDIIYIDPPYGCNDMGEFAKTNYSNEISRDNLLSMLYIRLQLAKQLLTEDGVIFCSIDDKNQAYLKCMFDDVFGEENFICNFVWEKTHHTGKQTKNTCCNVDYVLCYAKSLYTSDGKVKSLLVEKFLSEFEDAPLYNASNGAKTLRFRPNSVFFKSDSVISESTNDNYVLESPIIPILATESHTVNGVEYKYTNSTEVVLTFTSRWSQNEIDRQTDIGTYFIIKGDGCAIRAVYSDTKEDTAIAPWQIIKTGTNSEVGTNEEGSKCLEKIFGNRNNFAYPKPSSLIKYLLKLCQNKDMVVLDFFAGSGTTGQAVLELNKEDGGNRQFILCTNNEISSINPNGIAYDVTTKRLKRVMTGECYDGTNDFEWLKKNEPYGDNLEVTEIKEISPTVSNKNNTPFDIIDETLYDILPFENKEDKISWICTHFQNTMKKIETDTEYINRWGE